MIKSVRQSFKETPNLCQQIAPVEKGCIFAYLIAPNFIGISQGRCRVARGLPWQQVFNNSPSSFCGNKKLSDSPYTCSCFFYLRTCGGRLLLALPPQELVYCCSDYCNRAADVFSSTRDISVISSQAFTHTFTQSVCSFESDIQSDYPLSA